MKVKIIDYSMSPFLKPDDEIEFESGQPIPVCVQNVLTG